MQLFYCKSPVHLNQCNCLEKLGCGHVCRTLAPHFGGWMTTAHLKMEVDRCISSIFIRFVLTCFRKHYSYIPKLPKWQHLVSVMDRYLKGHQAVVHFSWSELKAQAVRVQRQKTSSFVETVRVEVWLWRQLVTICRERQPANLASHKRLVSGSKMPFFMLLKHGFPDFQLSSPAPTWVLEQSRHVWHPCPVPCGDSCVVSLGWWLSWTAGSRASRA